jgi:2-polyprenyl-6-hydroxyphenyl methylase/3-demethylubiquinone-9 3-methyltransferase
MSHEQRPYGWTSAEQNHSHAYLLPGVTRHLLRLFGGRRIRLVDLGCGNGFVTAKLAELGHDVMGFDASPDGIELARKAHPELRFEVASVYEDDLKARVGGDVDAVISLEVLEHLYAPKRLFEQSHRLLRQGGALILSTPYHGYWKNLAISLLDGWDRHFDVNWDGGHIKFFSVKTASAMARAATFRRVTTDGVGRLPLLWKSMILIAEK